MLATRLLPFVLIAAACAHDPRARFKEVTGGERWDAVAIIESKGTISVGGLTGPFEMHEDARDGRRVTQYTIGPMTGAEGFDGEHGWWQSPGGEVISPDSEEELAQERTARWMTQRGYWKKTGAQFAAAKKEEHEGRRYTVIEATPEGGVPIELWFNDSSGLLEVTKHKNAQDTIVDTYADYRDAGGVLLPFKEISDVGEPRNLTTSVVENVQLLDTAASELFARPAEKNPASFIGAEKKTEIPFELINNHIYIQAKIDDQPVRVLVDTGGANILTPAAAKRLGLAVEGKMAARGVGEQQIDLGVTKGKSLQLGEVRVEAPSLNVLELGTLLDVEGFEFDGLVGYEVFHRFIVRIDYPGRKLTLFDPRAFTAPAGAKVIPFSLEDTTPLIKTIIDGVEAVTTVDTGSRSSLSCHAPFTKKQELSKKYAAKFQTVGGWGVGGPLYSWPVRMHEVKIGDLVVHDVAGDLFTGDKGAFSNPKIDANLGGGILSRFVVTFDYEQRRMYLEPGAKLDERENYDRAGVWIMHAPGAVLVGALTPKGPAEKAGLKEGDRMTAIDGKPAASRELADWRKFFRETAPGTRVTIELERDGTPRDAVLTLEELLP